MCYSNGSRRQQVKKNNFNAYFMSRLFSGVFAVANDYDKYKAEISAILKARDLDSAQLPF